MTINDNNPRYPKGLGRRCGTPPLANIQPVIKRRIGVLALHSISYVLIDVVKLHNFVKS